LGLPFGFSQATALGGKTDLVDATNRNKEARGAL